MDKTAIIITSSVVTKFGVKSRVLMPHPTQSRVILEAVFTANHFTDAEKLSSNTEIYKN